MAKKKTRPAQSSAKGGKMENMETQEQKPFHVQVIGTDGLIYSLPVMPGQTYAEAMRTFRESLR